VYSIVCNALSLNYDISVPIYEDETVDIIVLIADICYS